MSKNKPFLVSKIQSQSDGSGGGNLKIYGNVCTVSAHFKKSNAGILRPNHQRIRPELRFLDGGIKRAEEIAHFLY